MIREIKINKNELGGGTSPLAKYMEGRHCPLLAEDKGRVCVYRAKMTKYSPPVSILRHNQKIKAFK